MGKKLSILVFISGIVLFSIFSGAKYYNVSSDEWRMVDYISRIAGVAGPSSFGPVGEDQLLLSLERSEKNGAPKGLVDAARAKIINRYPFYRDDYGTIGLSLSLNPEVYLQTNGGEMSIPPFDYDSDWFIREYRDRPDTLSITLENTIGDFLYSRFVLPLREKQETYDYYWKDGFHVSLQSMAPFQNFPLDAGISLNSKGLSLIIGMGKVSLGEGKTGNTAIGDNYDYQEFMKLGFNTRNTGVFLNLTSFDSGRKTINDSNHVVNVPYRVQNSKFSGYRELRHSVDYEMTLFDKAKFSLSFITLFDTDTAFDFRYLNPFMIMHNMFNYHEDSVLEGNNMITLDVSWNIAKGFRLYFQTTMDQYQAKAEAEGYFRDYNYVDPNAFAFLLNLSYTEVLREGILSLFVESVYTAPGMYLNQKYYDSNGSVTQIKTSNPCWSQDFLLGYNRTETPGYDGDMAFSGYIYGPDAIVFAFGGEYFLLDKLDIASRVFYMAHGEKGRGDAINNYNFSSIEDLETINRLSPTGVVEHTFVVKTECNWILSEFVSIYGGIAYSYRWNYRNENGRNVGNLQTAFGMKLNVEL